MLTGGGTVKEDNPTLNVRDVQTQRQPWKVIVDSKLETPLDAKLLNGIEQSGVIIFSAHLQSSEQLAHAKLLRERGVEVIELPNAYGKVDLPQLFAYLAQECHMNEIHVEAGAKLNGSLLREDCIDELLLYYAPFFIGEGLGMSNLPAIPSLKAVSYTHLTLPTNREV